MHRRRHRTERLDVPATIRELYPNARIRRRLRVLERDELHGDDREVRGLRRVLRAILFLGFAIPMWLATNGEGAGDESQAARASGAVTRWLFRVKPIRPLWDRWARARGGIAADSLPEHPTIAEDRIDRSGGSMPTYYLQVGPRRVRVHLAAVAVGSELATHHGAYVALVQLPAAVAQRFPGSSFVHRSGRALTDSTARRGRPLALESTALHDGAQLVVVGGDELDWRRLMDPALMDLVTAGIHVEWIQQGDVLLLHTPAPMQSIAQPEAHRLDALCVAAAAIERRFATIAGDGRALPVAVPEREHVQVAAMGSRHLKRERARDLAMSIEEQLLELGRYTTPEEVARVRAGLDSGQFRADWLDDLLHHRRAAFWGAGGGDLRHSDAA
jgi:hypothetical protein